MELTSSAWLMIWGAVLLVLGFIVMWRTSRHDLVGVAAESAWQVATGGRTAENPTAIEEKLSEITGEATATGKAKKVAGTVIGHVYARVMGIVSLVMMVIGAGLIAAGYWWR